MKAVSHRAKEEPVRIFFKPALTITAALISVSTAQAFEIDPNIYFAYLKVPDSYEGGVSVHSPYYLLSHNKCEATKGAENMIAYKGLAYNSYTGQKQPQCWTKFKSGKIAVCAVGPTETGSVGNVCIYVPQTEFIDTISLPKQAGF